MTAIPPPLPHDPRERPAFSWRGLLVDSAHTFWPVPAMELFLSLMARYRFNVLHWRLTDDRGWRMPVPGFPRLTSVGAQLPRTTARATRPPARTTSLLRVARRPSRDTASTPIRTSDTSSPTPPTERSASFPRSASLPGQGPLSVRIRTWETPTSFAAATRATPPPYGRARPP